MDDRERPCSASSTSLLSTSYDPPKALLNLENKPPTEESEEEDYALKDTSHREEIQLYGGT
jgi:hypothetical protein